MSFGVETIRALRENDFVVLLPQISLARRGTRRDTILTGVGQIEQDKKQRLALRAFLSEPALDVLSTLPKTDPGQIVSDGLLFDLIGVDEKGYEWRADQLYLLCKGSGNKEVCIVHSYIRQLRRVTYIDAEWEPKAIQIYFDQDVDIPFLDTTSRSTTFEGREISSSIGLNTTIKDLGPMKYVVAKKDGVLSVDVSLGELPSPTAVAHIFTAAMQFVTGREIAWRCFETSGDRTSVSCLQKGKEKSQETNFKPPLQEGLWWGHRSDFWQMFDRIVLFLWNADQTRRDRVCYLLARSIQDCACSVDSSCRAMTIAIEELVRLLELDQAVLGSEELGDLGEVRSIVERYFVQNGRTSSRINRRLLGSIDAMRHGRAKDALIALRDQSVITEAEFSAWDKLRNAQAHGEIANWNQLQTTLHRLDCVICILHRVLLWKVGYLGGATAYSQQGWPTVYPASHQNIQDPDD